MAYSDYLTTTCTIHEPIEIRGEGGAFPGDVFTEPRFTLSCSQPIPLNPQRGDTLGRDGLILTHAVMVDGPRRGIGPGWQVRIDGRRFDVDSEIDSVGFGRIVKLMCREVVG